MYDNFDTIIKVLDYIEENITEKLELDKISKIDNYSKYHLNRIFSEIAGCTIHQYIQKRRLTEAARDLVFTNVSIIDIAELSGYDSQQAFTLAFKKQYNKSPQVFRKENEFYPLLLKEDIEVEINNIKQGKISCSLYGGLVA